MPKTKILICSSEVGAGKRGASLGPDAIRISAVNLFYNIFDKLPSEEIKTKKINKFSPEHKSAKYIKLISQTHQKICRKMAETMLEGYNTLILSGDHSNSAGFIAGMREAYPDKKIGLIWIDAHGDIHSPYTSPSGNMHGMPVAIMLGYDNMENQIKKLRPEVIKNWEKVKRTGKQKITPKLSPEDICYIAIRDLEKQEWETIDKLNIQAYPPKTIREKSLNAIIKEIISYYSEYDAVYVSFDVDSLDTSISVGTGTPVADGLSQDDAEKIISALTKMPNFRALEITEVNPLLDTENKMATTVVKILRNSFAVE